MKTLHCPNCGTPFVRATVNEGTVEHLLSRINVVPFRCQLCTNRFRAFYSWRQPKLQAFDRRQFKRLPTAIDARVLDESQLPCMNRVIDISMDGCTLMMTGLSKGAFIKIWLKPSSEYEEIQIDTAMVCSVHPGSVGLQFLEIAEPDHQRLSQVVLGLLVSQGHPPPYASA